MHNELWEKTRESLSALLPITFVVLILNFTIAPMPFSARGLFIIGAAMLVIGMSLFMMGADMALMPIGEHMGQYLSKSGKVGLIVLVCLLMGTMVTITEPDLQVLAKQTPGIPNQVLILAVAAGLGIFLVIAVLRVIFRWNMSVLLSAMFGAALAVGIFVPDEYLSVSFDASGVTTGPFTTPFILALGIGISAVRGGKSSLNDSFGLAAICGIGPIFAIMSLSLFYEPDSTPPDTTAAIEIGTVPGLLSHFAHQIPEYIKEIGVAVAPLIGLLVIFQVFALKLPKPQMIKIGIGLLYTFIGLSIFLSGVSIGFMPAGSYIGQHVGGLDYNWVLIPIGAVVGFFIVLAEPAVHVLIEQIEILTSNIIPRSLLLRGLSISVAAALAVSMARVVYGISIWWFLLPGYAAAIALSFIVPKFFVAIAFDSGAVATGPMTATFVLPFTLGACVTSGGNILLDAFGVIAMVAMMPLVTMQFIGLMYKVKTKGADMEETRAIEGLSAGQAQRVDLGLAARSMYMAEDEDYIDFDETEDV
ncbi:MAG: DUF1538 domain-containing protein [Clostridiales bacterium]|nr:DUF1538 domain-containing protein [Clostridiales bacterium]